MKYTNEIELNLPIEKVIALFDDPANLPKWQPGLISFENISGTPGAPGAKSKLIFKMDKRDVEMIETITVKNLPDEFSGTYEMKGVMTIQKNKFIALSSFKTKWISESEIKFKGAMRVLAPFMKNAFKAQSYKYQELFKAFAESNS